MTHALSLVQTTGQQAFTTSLVIAKEYGKDHDKVLRTIRGMLSHENEVIKKFAIANFGECSYIDQKGASRVLYHITEDGFLELAMSFTGDKARETRIRFIKAFRQAVDFINKEFANPPRTGILQSKRDSMWDMTGAVKDIREELGKTTAAHHYSNENLLVNWALTGVRKTINEKALTNDEVVMLEKLRKRNAAFILAGMEHADRKTKLKDYADRLKVIKPCLSNSVNSDLKSELFLRKVRGRI